MNIETHIPAGCESAIIWEWPDGKQLLGPQLIEIGLLEPDADASPWPLHLGVALGEDRRYVITQLAIRAGAMADLVGGASLTRPTRVARLMPSPDFPPITTRGIMQISLPAILRRALYRKFSTRFRDKYGDLVERVALDDEPDVIYMRAQAMGEDPTKAVAKELGISPGAAAQRVARARKQGLLPPTTRGAR